VRASLATLAVVSLIGLATPALADAGPAPSIQRAVAIASSFGVVAFNEIQYYDGKWEIEGRDPGGRTVYMDIDAVTGAVVKIHRD